jgi:hypothetical protein
VLEAEREAEAKVRAEEQRKRMAAAKKRHAAGVRRQKKLLRELGVPDVSAEEVARSSARVVP